MTQVPQPRRKMMSTCAAIAWALAAGTFTGSTLAQDTYPAKPIVIVVPQAAGGANDTVARAFAQRLGPAIGQSVVVENRTGAGGNVGTAQVARAPKDGYTLLLTAQSAQTINPALYRNPGFDPVNDFAPIMTVATAPYLLVAHPGFQAKTLKEVTGCLVQNRPCFMLKSRFFNQSAGNQGLHNRFHVNPTNGRHTSSRDRLAVCNHRQGLKGCLGQT